jgi:hypothetical protein
MRMVMGAVPLSALAENAAKQFVPLDLEMSGNISKDGSESADLERIVSR